MLEKQKQKFQKQERVYGVLLILFVGLYMLVSLFLKPPKEETKPSRALQEFRAAEEKWQEEIKNPEKIEEKLERKPVISLLFNLLSFLIIGAFSLGLIFDFFLLFRPNWRRSIMRRGPPETFQWPLYMVLKVVVLWIFLSVGLSFFLGIIKNIFYPDLSFNFFAILHTSIMDLMVVALVVYVIMERRGDWRDLGFRISRSKIVKEIGVGVAGYLAVLPVFFIVLIFLVAVARLFAYQPEAHPLVEIFLEEERRSPWLVIYSIFLASIVGPAVEEIFFRGFCYPILKQKWGMVWAMMLNSALFAFIHQNEFAFWPIFVLGMALSFLYEKRRNLVSPITLHIIHNCFFLAYFFLAKQVILGVGGG